MAQYIGTWNFAPLDEPITHTVEATRDNDAYKLLLKWAYEHKDIVDDPMDFYVEKVQDMVDYKIDLLYDFAILVGRDRREPLVRKWLKQCGTEYQMTTRLHDVIRGRKPLNTALKEAGFEL